MVLMHENHRLGTHCLHIQMPWNAGPLNFVGWQETQISAHAKALVGTVNTASLNEATVQGGHVFASEFLCLISLEDTPWLK